MNKIAVVALLAALPLAVHAEGAPWLSVPGSSQLSVSLLSQAGDDFWVASTKMTLPAKIKQQTLAVSGQYVFSDAIAFDATVNYARSRFAAPAGFPLPHGEESGLADSSVGVKWRLSDEFEMAGVPTVAVRGAVNIKGNYGVGKIDAIGDAASGAEVSLLLGKYLTPALAISGELGYRYRDNGVPADVFAGVSLNYGFSSAVSGSFGYSTVRGRGNFDIGAPGFSPARFPEVSEQRDLVRVGLAYSVAPRTSIGINYGRVVSGRNTTKSELLGLSLSNSF